MTVKEQIQALLYRGEILEIKELLKDSSVWNQDLLFIKRICSIFELEVKRECAYTILDYSLDLDELIEHFVRIKMLVRRVEMNMPVNYQMELCTYCKEHQVSTICLMAIVEVNMFQKKMTYGRMADIFAQAYGENSPYALYFRGLEKSMEEA